MRLELVCSLHQIYYCDDLVREDLTDEENMKEMDDK